MPIRRTYDSCKRPKIPIENKAAPQHFLMGAKKLELNRKKIVIMKHEIKLPPKLKFSIKLSKFFEFTIHYLFLLENEN